jgi:hypothetical protein
VRPLFVTAIVVLSVLAGPAIGAVHVAAEQQVADPVPAPPEGNQFALATATDGEQFLTIWGSDGGRIGLNVTLVAADGRWLSSLFLPGTENAGVIGAYWTGVVYILWLNKVPGICTVTFSRNGDVLEPLTVVIPEASSRSGSIAWDGNRALMLYVSKGALTPVKVALVNGDGSLIKAGMPGPALGGVDSWGDLVPHGTTDGSRFAAVWETADYVADPGYVDGRRIVQDFHLMRITENGEMDGPRIDIGRLEINNGFGVAYGRGLYAIVAIQDPASPLPQLVRFVIDAGSGSVTRLPAIAVVGSASSIFWSGGQFVAYWRSTSGLKTLPFNGAHEDEAPETVTHLALGDMGSVVLASNGRNAFVVWVAANRLNASPVYGALFDANATAKVTADPPEVISPSWSRQYSPSIATSGSDSLVVWIEASTDIYSGRLLGARLSASGALLDAIPFEISPSVSRFSESPVIVFTGTVYLVAWVDGGFESANVVKVRRVGRDASLSVPISLGRSTYVSAATNGTTTLVVFGTVAGSGFGAVRVTGYRFDEIGNSIDQSPIVISDSGSAPRAASNGTDFFVAWNEGDDFFFDPIFSLPPNLLDVFGARVHATGAVDAAALPIAVGPSDQILAGLASDGRDYLVSYLVKDSTQSFLAAKHILRDGNLDGVTAQDDGTIVERGVDSGGVLSGDASGYWTAFNQSNGAAAIVRTDAHGAPRSEVVPYATASDTALAQIPGGAVWIAYARHVDGGAFPYTNRVFVRFATEQPDVPRSRAARH